VPSSTIDNTALNSHIANNDAHGLNVIRETISSLNLNNILNKQQVEELINNEAIARNTQITTAINTEADSRQTEINQVNNELTNFENQITTELQNTNVNLNQNNTAIWGAENYQGILNGAYGTGKITDIQNDINYIKNLLPKKVVPISQEIGSGNIVITFNENLGNIVTIGGQLVFSVQGSSFVNFYFAHTFVNYGGSVILNVYDNMNLGITVNNNTIVITVYNNNLYTQVLSLDHLIATYVSFPAIG